MVHFTGAHDRSGQPTSVQKTFNVRRLIMHEQFTQRGLNNDIALLQLDGSITPSNKVNIVCLPQQGSRVPAGTQCYITGN